MKKEVGHKGRRIRTAVYCKKEPINEIFIITDLNLNT